MDWNMIILAGIAALPPTILAFAALRKASQAVADIQEVHISLNSRLSELLRATAAESYAEGVEAERAREAPLRAPAKVS